MRFITDPVFNIAFRFHLLQWSYRQRLHETVFHHVGIYVQLPVKHFKQEIEVSDAVFWRTIPQEFLRHDRFVHKRLIHRKNIGSFLRFVRAHAPGRMQQSRRNVPSRAGLQAIRCRVVGNFVVAFCKVDEALTYLFLRSAGGDPKKRIREIAAMVVYLRREIVRFRFSILSYHASILIVGMHMMRQRTHVVEKLGIHRPAFVLLPDALANQCAFQVVDCIF